MERGESTSSSKPDRKTVEKNRRSQMKNLIFKLVSLIPDHHVNIPKEFLSEQDRIEKAGAYIKILRERIEELKGRKTQAVMNSNATNYNMGESKLPILEIKELGSDVEVVLISGLNKNFMVHKIISIIQEEGAQVVTLSISTVGDRIFHTLHAQAKLARVGVDTSRISERIHKLIA